MKKSLLAVVAALAMTGCSQSELDEVDNGSKLSKTPISFNSVVMKNSRATATTTSNFNNFTVKAYSSAAEWAGEAKFYFTDNLTYSNAWAGEATVYWPATANVHFFGYSPQSAATYNPSNGDLTGFPTLTYDVPTESANQVDLVAACLLSQTKPSSGGAISLPFKHTLTQINFSIKLPTKNLIYKINSITLENVNSKGTFTYASGENIGTWNTNTPMKYTYSPSTIDFTPTNDEQIFPLHGDNNALILLPQTGTIKLNVTYEIQQAGVLLASETKSTNISAAWTPGQNILYEIALPASALEKIQVNGSLSAEWDNLPSSTEHL